MLNIRTEQQLEEGRGEKKHYLRWVFFGEVMVRNDSATGSKSRTLLSVDYEVSGCLLDCQSIVLKGNKKEIFNLTVPIVGELLSN